MGEAGAQLIQDREPVGIDVAPVKHLAASQPFGLRQHLETVTGAEDQQTVGDRRECQVVDLVLGDENPGD